jgi:methionyl-tRNA formyltransferase
VQWSEAGLQSLLDSRIMRRLQNNKRGVFMHKVLLLGSGDFARGVLEGILATEHRIVGFFPWEARSKPTLQTRIKRHFVPDNIALAEQYDFPVLQMRSANSAEFAERVAALAPDIIVVAGWGEILKPDIIELPALAMVNSHPSLLPRHRGASPIASVLREGEKQTGVTFHYLTPKIDAGHVLYRSALSVYEGDDYASLARRIARRAKETIGLALARVGEEGEPQNESEASYFHRLQANDIWLDWAAPAQVLRNRIRSAAPGGYFRSRHRNRTLFIREAELVELHQQCVQPGRVLDKSGSRLLIATGDPNIALFVRADPANNRLGPLGAKWYCHNNVQLDEILGR